MQDKQQIEILWNKIYSKLVGYISKNVNSTEDVNDIIQNTFIKVKNNIDTLKNPLKADKWIFQIARNTMNDYFRAQKKNLEYQNNYTESYYEPDAFENEEINVKIKTQEISEYADFIIEGLPEKYKQAVLMADIEGLSMKEVAENLKLSVSGAKSRVQRGRKLIKELILKCCEIQTDVYGNIVDYEPHNCKICKNPENTSYENQTH